MARFDLRTETETETRTETGTETETETRSEPVEERARWESQLSETADDAQGLREEPHAFCPVAVKLEPVKDIYGDTSKPPREPTL